MATVIKIKTSGTNATPSSPTLATGEFAYSYLNGSQSNGGDRLYIGTGTETNGEAANMEVIGGKYFTDMMDHVTGTLTASSAVLVDSNSKIDQWLVDNIKIDGNTISSTDTNGDINLTPHGTGSVNITNAGFTGDTSIVGSLSVDNLTLDGNTISSSNTNGDISLTPNGSGAINLANFKVTNDTIETTSGNSITIDPYPAGGNAAGTVYIQGSLTVYGTTTTVNSTEVTIDDAIFTLGGDTALIANDNLDKGISFQWYDSSAKEGFFGWDESTSTFKIIPDATFVSGVVSGTLGNVEFGSATLTDLSFDATGTGYATNSILYTNASNEVGYLNSATEGHVLQINASNVPFFGHINCGTY